MSKTIEYRGAMSLKVSLNHRCAWAFDSRRVNNTLDSSDSFSKKNWKASFIWKLSNISTQCFAVIFSVPFLCSKVPHGFWPFWWINPDACASYFPCRAILITLETNRPNQRKWPFLWVFGQLSKPFDLKGGKPWIAGRCLLELSRQWSLFDTLIVSRQRQTDKPSSFKYGRPRWHFGNRCQVCQNFS